MQVRPGRHDDLLSIARVAEAGFWESYAGLLKPDTIGRLLALDYAPSSVARRLLRGGVIVVEDDEGVAGFVDAIPGTQVIPVSAIAIDPMRRRQGFGKALIDEVLRRHEGLPLSADVLLGNLDGEAFLESLGFVPGEIVQGSLFDESVVERRWWRESDGGGIDGR